MTSDGNSPDEPPELEAPPPSDAPVGGLNALFADEAQAVGTAGRFTICEALINLLPRACKYHEFTREILLAVMRVVKAEAGSFLEVDHSAKVLFFRAVVGQSSDKVSKFKIPLGQGVVGHVAESRLPLSVPNAREERLHMRSIGNAVGFEARNIVAVPIVVRGKTFGVIELLNRIGEDAFTAADVELLTYASEMVARAIEVRLMLNWVRNRSGASSPTEKAT